MRFTGRRRSWVFFVVLGSCLTALAVALYVGWILLSFQQIVVLILGIVFFSLIITGLVLNTLFLIREIRRNEQHNAFLNAVTHELKTPIASIRLYLETLQKRDITAEKRREFYAAMLTDSDRLLNTVEQVLQASRLREQKRLQSPVRIELGALLRESIDRAKAAYDLDEKAIEFKSPEKETIISGNETELQAVFINLLDNAVKYSDGEIKILISIKDLNEKKVEVRIRDSGIGIPPAELKRVFKRFYRVQNLETQKEKGTGLGLFIAASIIKNHGGKIRVESGGVHEGSRFIIQLPKSAEREI